MFKLKFGAVWTIFTTIIFGVMIIVPGDVRNGVELNIPIIIFFLIFEAVGISLLVSGIKQVIKDKKTTKYGLQCYGIVRDILQTGSYTNNQPEYKVVVDFVNPESQQVQTLEEITGFDYNKYPINYYVMCKYYDGDINIDYSIDESQAPEDVKKLLKATVEEPVYAYSADQPEPQPMYNAGVVEQPATAEEAAQAQQAYVNQMEQQQQAYANQVEQGPAVDPLQQLAYSAPVQAEQTPQETVNNPQNM